MSFINYYFIEEKAKSGLLKLPEALLFDPHGRGTTRWWIKQACYGSECMDLYEKKTYNKGRFISEVL